MRLTYPLQPGIGSGMSRRMGFLWRASCVALGMTALVRLVARRWWTYEMARRVCWACAFGFGVVGTTVLSRWFEGISISRGLCLFSWHSSLLCRRCGCVAPHWSRQDRSGAAYGAAAFFLVTCAAYFWTCRRLSLVTEWAFLCGFAAALPCSVAGSHCGDSIALAGVWEVLWTCAGFAAYYWSSVLVQVWKG